MKGKMKFLVTGILAFAVSAFSVFAASVEVVNVNGSDRLEVTNTVTRYNTEPEEGADITDEFMCVPGARLSTLEEDTITLVLSLSGGDGAVAVVPDNYTQQELNEYGQLFGLPKGGSYTFNENGMYFYNIQFADNTVATGYIHINADNAVLENSSAEEVQPKETESIPVVSKAQRIQIEEELAEVDAYNIYGNNYIKLRDFAYYYTQFGNYMDKHFDVTWDGEKNAINLVAGREYTVAGGEGELNIDVQAQAVESDASVYLNGEYIPLTAYNINGNNYFKLRDLCEAMDLSISWWPQQQIIYVNNDYGYGKEFEEIAPEFN